MAQNLPSRPAKVRQSVYWRRRAAVLALGLGVVSVVAWAVSGLLGGGPHVGSAAAAATGQASGHGRATHAGAASAGATPAGTASAAGTPAGAGQQTSARPPAGVPPACAPHDVVVSLTTNQGSYGPGALPHFTVYLVSLGGRDCSVNVGPGYLSVVIKAGGTRRIWDSADCTRAASRFVQLSQGVPQVQRFSWDRKGSSPGCRLATASARPGTYTATAVAPAAHLASRGTVFVLTGRGTAMP